jgi:phytoene dehydrogenase-like protein
MAEPAQARYDAIVIGGGHNGLTAAAYLAKAGFKVLLLERRHLLGGAAATEPLWPELAGKPFAVNTGCWDAGLFLPEIGRDLALEQHGLQFLESPALVHSLLPGGQGLTIQPAHLPSRDPGQAVAERARSQIAALSAKDAASYPAFAQQVAQLAEALRPILTLAPPPLKGFSPGELLSWLPSARWLYRRLAGSAHRRPVLIELLRVLPMSVSDWLDEWFESPALKAALGAPGTFGNLLGPRASGTAFMLLYQALGARGAGPRASRAVRGGAGALSAALAGAARRYGAEICTGLAVRQIWLQDDRAAGVILQDGRRLSARAVLSSADPRSTFFGLVGAPQLDVRLVRQVRHIKFRGSLARLNLALRGLPAFPGVLAGEERERLSGRILICPDLDYLERACDDAKYGSFSRQPCLSIAIPTLLDPDLAPPGYHQLSVDVQYAPYHLKAGDWDSQHARLEQRVLETLEQWLPGIGARVAARQLLTPLDLEREYGLPEGCIYHGQMGLDQLLFMRPVAGESGNRTAVKDLYLCGAGAHPGGGLTGAPGYQAARQVIRALRRQT